MSPLQLGPRLPWRRIGRIAVHATFAIVATVMVVLLAAIGVLHTDWGRERLRAQVEAILDDLFVGEVTLGAIEGSAFGDLTIRDLVIDDAAGRPAVSVAAARIQYDLLPLIRQRVDLERIVVRGLVVEGREEDGVVNLTKLLVEKDEPDEPPSSWDVEIGELSIGGAEIGLDREYGVVDSKVEDLHLDDVALGAGLLLEAGGATRASLDLGATWRETGLGARVVGAFALREGVIEVPALAAHLGQLALTVEKLKVDGFQVAGDVSLSLPADGLRKVVPGSPLREDVALTLHTQPAETGEGTRVQLGGALGSSPIHGEVALDPEARHVAGHLGVADVDLRELLAGAASTAFDLDVDVDLTQLEGKQGVAALRGDVGLDLRGPIGSHGIHRLSGKVALDQGKTRAELGFTGAGKTTIKLDGAATVGAGPIVLERAHLVGSIGELGDAARPVLVLLPPPVARDAAEARELERARAELVKTIDALGGVFEFDLNAKGTLGERPDLALAGRITGRGIESGVTKVTELDVELDGRGLPGDPQGNARIEAREVFHDGAAVGLFTLDARSQPDRSLKIAARSRPHDPTLAVDLDATVRFGEVVRVALDRHLIQTRGITWKGEGGAVELHPDRVVVDGFHSTVEGGRLAIDATYVTGREVAEGAPPDPRAGDVKARVALEHLDLGKVTRSLASFGVELGAYQPRGVLDLRASVDKRGRRVVGSVVGAANDVALVPGVAPLTAGIDATIDPKLLRIVARASTPEVGGFTLELDVTPPGRIDDGAAWQRLERAAIRKGRLAFDKIDLAQAARFAGAAPVARGRIDGGLTMTSTDTTANLKVTAVRVPQILAPIDAEMIIDRVELGVVHARLGATVGDIVSARAETTVRLPTRPFDVAAWNRIDADAMRGATITIDKVLLDAERSRRLGLGVAYHGRASGKIELAPGLASGTVTVNATGLRGDPLVRPVDLGLTGSYDGRLAQLEVRGALEKKPILRLNARVPLPIAALQADPARAMQRAPLAAQLLVEKASVRSLRRAVGSDAAVSGSLSVDARVAGTVGRPTGSVQVTLASVGISGQRQLRELVATGWWDGKQARAQVKGVQDDGGRLDVDAQADPRQLDKAIVLVTATRFDLGPLTYLMPPAAAVTGVIDGKLTLRGADPANARLTGKLEVTQARVPLAASIGALRRGTISLQIGESGAMLVQLAGDVGQGKLRAGARGKLVGLMPQKLELEARVDDVALITAAAPTFDALVKATVERRVKRKRELWVIEATVDEATVVLPNTEGHELHEAGAPDDLTFIEDGRPPARETEPKKAVVQLGVRPSQPTADITIDIKPTWVTSKEFRGQARGNVHIVLGGQAMALDGAIRVSRGNVELFDRRYRLERAQVRFDDSFDPLLDIEIVHDFPDLTFYADVRGRLSKPELLLRSDPPTFSESELFGILIGGSPGGGDSRGGGAGEAATGAATSMAAKTLLGGVQEFLPVKFDVLRFDRGSPGSSASFTIGKWLSQKTYLAYRRRLAAEPEQNAGEAELEYWLGRNVLLDGVVGDRGIHGVDLLWLRRW